MKLHPMLVLLIGLVLVAYLFGYVLQSKLYNPDVFAPISQPEPTVVPTPVPVSQGDPSGAAAEHKKQLEAFENRYIKH